jgi:chaperonin GroEL (HSP60 family)
VINSATEAASMILRIDDVIAASKPQKSEGPAGRGGMGAGGGEMGDFGE